MRMTQIQAVLSATNTNSCRIDKQPIHCGKSDLFFVIKVILIFLFALFIALPVKADDFTDLFKTNKVEQSQQDFLKVEDAFTVVPMQQDNHLSISIEITPEHYIYKDKLALTLPDGVTVTPFTFSQDSHTIDDPIFGEVAMFDQNQVTVTATLTNTTTTPIDDNATLTWQGCAKAGLCYPPQKEPLQIKLAAADTVQPANSANTSDALVSNPQIQPATVTDNNTANTDGSDTNATNTNPEKTSNLTASGSSQSGSTGEQKVANSASSNSASSNNTSSNNVLNSDGLLGADTVVNQDPFGLSDRPWLGLLLLFLAGIGLAFTPCILPMLPIVSNIVAHQHKPTAKGGLLLSGSYAIGVATAYGILGAIIAVFGQSLGIIGWLQNPIILLTFAVVFILLALYMLDAFAIPTPNKLKQKMQTISQAGDNRLGSWTGSFVAGFLSALVVSPCVSAPLFGALLAVSTIGNPVLGFAALFMLGFGLSAPLMLLGMGQGNLMPKAGEWMNWVKQGFALLLFAVALLLISRVLVSSAMLILWALWFMVVAVWLWSWQARGKLFTKPIAIVFMMWSFIMLVGAAAGSRDAVSPLRVFIQNQMMSLTDTASTGLTETTKRYNNTDIHITSLDDLLPIIQNNQKVLVDVTAEWCVECRIMDKTLFTNRPAELQDWQVVKLDVTESNAESSRVLSELKLFGPPALLYFVAGNLQRQQVGTVARSEFEESLAEF